MSPFSPQLFRALELFGSDELMIFLPKVSDPTKGRDLIYGTAGGQMGNLRSLEDDVFF